MSESISDNEIKEIQPIFFETKGDKINIQFREPNSEISTYGREEHPSNFFKEILEEEGKENENNIIEIFDSGIKVKIRKETTLENVLVNGRIIKVDGQDCFKVMNKIQQDNLNQEITETKEYVCKVIVVGDTGTGKTSLIRRYTEGTFDKNYKATIGVDFCLKEIKWNEKTTVSVQLWDIAGQERFANLTRMYYKEARGAFVVFDVTRDKTLDATLKWKADIDAKVTLPSGKVIPVILLANKCDLSEQPLNLDDFCKQHGFEKWFLTSAKEGIGIDEAARFLVQTILDNDEIMAIHINKEYQKGLNVTSSTHKSNDSKTNCCS
jgi:Ras-related protein Rab-32